MAKKHPELQGRKKSEIVTNMKKGSQMPKAAKNAKLLPFKVAPYVKMGHPNLDLDQTADVSVRTANAGDTVRLSKAQAEWCLANGFIDSELPSFGDEEDADTETAAPDGEGSSGGASEKEPELALKRPAKSGL